MDTPPKQDFHQGTPSAKKDWANPQLHLIDQANIAAGTLAGGHEANFTPKHTHYAPNGAGPFPTAVFNKYVS
jgi:hypothetical protein